MTESDFAGTYASAEMTLDLRVEDGRLGGEIILHGKRLPLRAALYGEHIYGSFGSLGTEFPFQAGFEGPHLRVLSGGAEYVLPVAAPGNPLAAMVPPAAAPPAPAPTSVEPQVFRHPTGGRFTIPPGWSALPSEGGVQLVPPGAGLDAPGPTEVYTVTTDPAPAISAADDPRVLAYLERSLGQMIPNVERAGAPEPVGSGIRFRHHARNPLTGGRIDVVAMVTLLRGAAVAVVGISEPAVLESRLPALEGVFRSLDWGEGDQDPTLVGTWHARSDGAADHLGDEARHTIELRSDGIAGIAGERGGRRLGTWNAGGGMLYLLWADGTSATWKYEVSGAPGGRRVTLRAPGASASVEWTESAAHGA
ncbi:MAG TPA: hypothetical protein VKE22_10505 [Haliangiales bacterium]|nr:hypothetical protein [Haliangiales bacterium]